jgi:hypothetical protein
MPEELQYNPLKDGIAEVWIRRNIQRVMAAHSDENDEENMEYIYDEVYFCTTSTREEIESDLEYYWKSGQEWNPSIPESDKQKIERLEQELSETKEQMTKNQLASDMTIAELTMVMADMMGGGEENV